MPIKSSNLVNACDGKKVSVYAVLFWWRVQLYTHWFARFYRLLDFFYMIQQQAGMGTKNQLWKLEIWKRYTCVWSICTAIYYILPSENLKICAEIMIIVTTISNVLIFVSNIQKNFI